MYGRKWPRSAAFFGNRRMETFDFRKLVLYKKGES